MLYSKHKSGSLTPLQPRQQYKLKIFLRKVDSSEVKEIPRFKVKNPNQVSSFNRNLNSAKFQSSIFGIVVPGKPSSLQSFGRIRRLVLRIATSRDGMNVVAVNDPFVDAKYMHPT
ncbi:unnamed protein product [Camellia sinensis]